ncbi:hypothetical protein GCM10011412_05080 [Maribacter cobaltidurans]|nr:hypothetical protein GCM10011412_05080 [Maribacter cobaltidurans]
MDFESFFNKEKIKKSRNNPKKIEMKTLFITFIMLTSTLGGNLIQDTSRVSGTYDRHEDGIYYFIGDNGEIYEFNDITEEASEVFDLMDEALLGKLFSITFTRETEENDDMEYNTIVALKILE